MLRATEFAFGLEKSWRQRHYDAQTIPWHLCLLTLIAGILSGDAWGPQKMSHGAIGFELSGFGGLFLLTCLCLIGLYLVWRWRRQQGETCRRWGIAAFIALWGTLWFITGLFLGCPNQPQTPPDHVLCEIEAEVISIEPGTSQFTAEIDTWTCQTLQNTGKARVRIPMNTAEMRIEGDKPAIFRGMTFKTEGWFEPYQTPDVPGMFDAKAWAHSAGLDGHFKRRGERTAHGYLYDPIQIIRHDMTWSAKLETWRRIAYEKLSSNSPEGILPALVLGCTRDIFQETRLAFGRLGIAHVLAVSGLHFGLIAIALNFILAHIFGHIPFVMRRFGKNRAAAAIALPALAIYLLFVGAPISAQRALLMVAVSTLARLANRKPERSRALCMAGILILLHDPMAVFSISFQLSFSAVLGIIWGSDFYERELRKRLEDADIASFHLKFRCSMISTLIMTVSTSLTTAPFVIWHFGQLPVIGTLTNLIVIPYVSFVLMPVAIITTLFITADLPFGSQIAQIAETAETYLVEFAKTADAVLPLNCLDMVSHPLVCVLSVLTAVSILYRFHLKPWRISCAIISVLVMSACLTFSQIQPRFWTKSNDLRMTFVAMGQADATLVEFPNGHVMLIDAGSELGRKQNSTQIRLMPYLRHQGIRHIDTLVLTHSDYDHIAGIQPLLTQITVGQIWHNGFTPESDPQFWQNLLPKHTHLMHNATHLPKQQNIDHANIEILWPRPHSVQTLKSQNALNANEMSIVLKLQYGQFSALFMGDAGIPVERHMLKNISIPPVTLLKAGHHGSKSASSQDWINAVQPAIAIFSTGVRNRYQFPHTAVQKRLHQSQTRMFRTDRHGTIQLLTDGQHMKLQTMHP